MISEIRLVAAKDLLIERRSRVVANQVLPFSLMVVVLFGFALDADSVTLRRFTPGLFWVTVLLVALLAINRGVAIESADGTNQALLLTGLAPSSIFLGKVSALIVQLLALEVVLFAAVVVLYDSSVQNVGLALITAVAATVGIASAGTLYGVLASGLGVRETILPVLLLPVLAPVLIGSTRAFDDAFGIASINGWAWLGLLSIFAVIYLVFGSLAYGVLLEES